MDDLIQVFEDRLQEIATYLDLLDGLEKQVQTGPPRLGLEGPTISVQQQRILYSSVYLQLYNLVEATITRCIGAITIAIEENGTWLPSDLSIQLRREWVRTVARTHVELNPEHRLESALVLCEYLVQSLPIANFEIKKGTGGSWDDLKIQDMSLRLGLSLDVSAEVFAAVKKHFRNEQGALTFIKNLRNDLAHGSQSFAECGEGVTVSDLRELTERTALYLKEVVILFKSYIDGYEFLLPERRPPRS